MAVLRLSGNEFSRAVDDPEALVQTMLLEFDDAGLPEPSPSEQVSWRNSLPVLAGELVAAGLEDVDILLEYRLPLTSQRVDAVLAGTHPETREPSFVLIELKQWSSVQVFEEDPNLLLVPGLPHPVSHPSRQVDGYRRYLVNYLEVLHGHEHWVDAVAYVHGMQGAADALASGSEAAPVFSSGSRESFQRYLRDRIAPVKDAATADLLLGSAVSPSTKLMKVAAEEVREREHFILLGEQQRAVDMIRHEIDRAETSGSKRVVIVSGGPGSGKSAIALSVLGELGREGKTALHATGSRSFTQTMRKVAGHRSRDTQSLFKYFNSFTHAHENGIEVLLADEAHRIRETSNNRYTRADLRSDRLQIDELITAARVPVFLLDDNQVVRNGELGSTQDIARFSAANGYDVALIELSEQFRCGGSAAYVEWVEQILGLTNEPPSEAALPLDNPFQVEVVDTPWELEDKLRAKDEEGYVSRITAGFCWPWSDPSKDGLVNDVVIGDWHRPWNNKSERRIGTAPPSALWATQPGGFDQVGCVYTAQGFEFDWAGVIIGPDLVWRDGQFESRRSENKDPQFRSRRQVPDDLFDRLVRNVYKVLLTRGMIGTILYSPDEQTRQALRSLLT